jgi:hypothetical protein
MRENDKEVQKVQEKRFYLETKKIVMRENKHSTL